MSTILGQLAIAIGGILFVVALCVSIAHGTPLLTAVFRASVVMCASSVAIAAFFRLFSSILYRYIAEQIMLSRKSTLTGGANAPGEAGQRSDV